MGNITSTKNIKDTHRKKECQIKLQRLQNVRVWEFGSLVYQINSLEEVLELKQNLQKNKVVPGKTPLFLICPFCSHHFIRLNIVFCMEMMPFQS